MIYSKSIIIIGGIIIRTAAVICEYNPFHNGHKYHLDLTRKELSATHIVCVMSGNYTQRGDIAVADKYSRAKTALLNGADLVIELPCAYSLSSSELFAKGACYILNSLGCVDYLSFGSECGDVSLLEAAADAVNFAVSSPDFAKLQSEGISYPSALKRVITASFPPEISESLDSPNNILGIEYIRALKHFDSAIKPYTVRRSGAAHDSDRLHDSRISASKIREMISDGEDISRYTPFADFDNTADISRLETAILARLRTVSVYDMAKIPNCTNGMENRIHAAVRESCSLSELYMKIKSKNCTLARIRRMILCGFLGITKNDLKNPPAYVRILGMNGKGREILAAAKCPLAMNTSLSALEKTGSVALRQATMEAMAGDIYSLALKNPRPCGYEYTAKPVIL